MDHHAPLRVALRWIGVSLLAAALLPLLVMQVSHAQGVAHIRNNHPHPTTVDPAVLAVEQSILDNMQQNGFDNNPAINNGLGGLWINWIYGSNPLETNINGSGNPDGPGVTPPRHDPFIELRYLHTLLLYKAQNPTDTKYDGEISRYTAIVKYEFAKTNDLRGWIVDEEFLDLYKLTNDPFYQNIAMKLAADYAKSVNPRVGIIYQTNSAHRYGFYRPDLAIEEGCALIQMGTASQPQNTYWIQLGQNMIKFVYNHAYIAQYNAFPEQLDRVLSSNGSVNPAETFYVDQYRNYNILGNLMKMGTTAQIIIALLHTYQATQNNDFLSKAINLLTPLSLPSNALHMWDTTNLGYYSQLQFTGKGPEQPGSIKVSTGKKEAGRQEDMLWAFHLADALTNNHFANMESLMQTVAVTKAYYAPGHGVLELETSQWTPVMVNKKPDNWVTCESMTIELEGLLDLNRASAY